MGLGGGVQIRHCTPLFEERGVHLQSAPLHLPPWLRACFLCLHIIYKGIKFLPQTHFSHLYILQPDGENF